MSIARRFREPSTWAGVGLVITQAATAVTTRDPVAIGGLLAGLLAIFRPESKPTTPPSR